MRAFIALELPPEIKTAIENYQHRLKKIGVQAKWVKPEQAHLTLAFLGSITPTKEKQTEEILTEIAETEKSIRLKLERFGSFPVPSHPRILFIDLNGELEKLTTLVRKIRQRLKKEKIWFDRKPFVPHLTLGRIKKRQNLTPKTKMVKIEKIEFLAQKISLMKSILTETGPIYTQLKCASLA